MIGGALRGGGTSAGARAYVRVRLYLIHANSQGGAGDVDLVESLGDARPLT